MSCYRAKVSWSNSGPDFLTNKYSRTHQWSFEGGKTIEATAAPSIVPLPWSDPSCVDPEQAFVASLSSCHMLFFLSFASRKGFQVASYHDEAEGFLEKNSDGRLAMTRVALRPHITFTGEVVPDEAAISELHHAAHQHCFIANSVSTTITIEPATTSGT